MTTTASSSSPAAAPPGLDERFRLSRHVVLRPTGEGLVLECALGSGGFPVAGEAVLRLVMALTRPVRVADLVGSVDGSRRDAVLAFLTRCRDAGVLTRVDADGRPEEDGGPAAHWEFHDLLFHTRSRRGRNRGRVGASFPLRGVLPAEPPFREARGGPTVALHRPSLDALERADPPLTRVLEARRSRYSVAPVSVEALGELLFRAFRVTGVEALPGDEDDPVARKVYPSAGSRHPIELYVVPWACEGLERGVWHYDARAHTLGRVCPPGPEVELLLEEARASTGGMRGYPPVLLVLAARTRRVAWKYQALAYAAVLKEAGGIFQTLYLVCTAMGLSPCALGAGDSDRFARVAGTDYYGESSVGEFIVGGPGGITGSELAERFHRGEPLPGDGREDG